MKSQYIFEYKKYSLNSLINKKNLISIINKFWRDIVIKNRIEKTKKLRVILILDYGKGDLKSLSNLVFVDKDNKTEYIQYISELLDYKHENYKTDSVINIYFKYINVLANASNIPKILFPCL
jgi:hypothetical protein